MRFRHWPAWLAFVVGAVAFIVILAVCRRVFALGTSEAIYVATGFLLLWYTVETQGMRREIVRQNQLSVQPMLLTSFLPAEGYTSMAAGMVVKPQLVVRNIGKGPALSVRIAEIPLPDRAPESVARFSAADCIQPGEAISFAASIFSRQGDDWNEDLPFDPDLNPQFATEDYELHIYFADIIAQRHECVVRMGKSGIALLGHRRLL